MTTTTTVAPTSQFFVEFSGIILHVNHPKLDPAWRAVVVKADLLRPHRPMLYVPRPADASELSRLKASLTGATREIVRCSKSQCGVRIDGASMRIRGNSRMPVSPNPIKVDPSFECLIPHLRNDGAIDAGGIRSEVVATRSATLAALPSGDAIGFFELENGLLEATPFATTAYFQSALDACLATGMSQDTCEKRVCREFGDLVTWSGETDGPAVLEIASDATAWKWKEIPVANDGPLMIAVENLASRDHPSTEHFALNRKLVTKQNLPTIVLYNKSCPNKCPAAPGFGVIHAVPGCSDSTWP